MISRIMFIAILLHFSSNEGNAQLWKRVRDELNAKVEQKVKQKAYQVIDNAIDSIGKKSKNKKESNQGKDLPVKNNNHENPSDTNDSNEKDIARIDQYNSQGSERRNEDESKMISQEGYIEAAVIPDMQLSGAPVLITGESMITDKLKEVEITVIPPANKNKPSIVKLVPLNKEGGGFKSEFKTEADGESDGDYTIKIKSSDGKGLKMLRLHIFSLPDLEEVGSPNLKLLKNAEDNLDRKIEELKTQTGSSDDKEIEEQLKLLKEKIEAARKMLASINKSCGELGKAAKTKGMPDNVRQELGSLNTILREQAKQMEALEAANKHQASNMTICELMVILSETCAAFSTFTNLYTTSIISIFKNIAIDKVIPKGPEMIIKKVGGVAADNDFWPKEAAKIVATSRADAEAFNTKLGRAGFAGDFLQYIFTVILKKYCVTFSGELQFNYDVIYRTEGTKDIWWKNGYDCGATVSLRYPKSQKIDNGIIKMKGNVEGNATKFRFYTDLSKALTDVDQRVKAPVIPLYTIKPAAVPFVSSQADALGFGAVARTLATPACFNLTIDAEYNVESKTIKFFYNDALVDFTPMVKTRAFYILMAVLPLPRYMEFPIIKMGDTFRGTLKRQKEFPFDPEKGFSAKGVMDIGDASQPFEHHAVFTMRLKKD